ncbi:signal peptidase I [Haladaptatus caseinilyticus]|uniref:signal peptidase I n=1 Tax=Haladaptatus caseinilyticus TaxID=2993314 RepID=UPI00224A7E1F|nr:signal peptidase I [Haladaptatus caseinilyticus]
MVSISTVLQKRCGTIILAVVVLLCLTPLTIFAVPQVVGADHSYVIVSSSMEPAVGQGDAIFVDSVSPQAVERGDIITFSEQVNNTTTSGSGQVVTHRVANISHKNGTIQFQTKGDANEEVDPVPIPASALIGVVTFQIPLLGYFIAFASTPLGNLALVGLPMGLLIVNEL